MYLFQAAASTTSSDALATVNSYISGVDFANPTWDLFIILFFIVSAFIYGMTLGRDRVILILISVYMGLAVIHAAPFLDALEPATYGPNNVFAFRITIFLALFVLLFFLLSRSALLRTLAKSDAPGALWQVVLFSVLHVGLLISITLSFIPEEFHNQLSEATRQWFIGEQAEFFWIIAPIAAMALIRDSDDDDE